MLWTRFSFRRSLYFGALSFSFSSPSVPVAEKQPYCMRLLPAHFTFGMYSAGDEQSWFPSKMILRIDFHQTRESCFCTLPQICASNTILSQRSTDTSLNFMAWFVLWYALLTVVPYIDRCVPFQIMSNQLNLAQVDSSQVIETSQEWSVETGCTWAQFWVSWQRLQILMYMWFFCHVSFFLYYF